MLKVEAMRLIKMTDPIVVRALETGTTPSREVTAFRKALFDVIEGRSDTLPDVYPKEVATWDF